MQRQILILVVLLAIGGFFYFDASQYLSLDFFKRSLPFMVVAFSFIGLAYGYGNAMMPLPMEHKIQLMSVAGTFLP